MDSSSRASSDPMGPIPSDQSLSTLLEAAFTRAMQWSADTPDELVRRSMVLGVRKAFAEVAAEFRGPVGLALLDVIECSRGSAGYGTRVAAQVVQPIRDEHK